MIFFQFLLSTKKVEQIYWIMVVVIKFFHMTRFFVAKLQMWISFNSFTHVFLLGMHYAAMIVVLSNLHGSLIPVSHTHNSKKK